MMQVVLTNAVNGRESKRKEVIKQAKERMLKNIEEEKRLKNYEIEL